MEVIDNIGFSDVSIEFKLAGRTYNITADPPIDTYWKLLNSIQKLKGEVGEVNKFKDYIIEFILDSHYSQLSPIKIIGKFFDRRFLKKKLGFMSLSNFVSQYFEVLKKYGVLKNVTSPRTEKK